MAIDYNKIIFVGNANGLTIQQSIEMAYILGMIKDLVIIHTKTLEALISMGFLDDEGLATTKGRTLFKQKAIDNESLAKKLRDMYPAGLKDGKWPWRGTNVSVRDKLNEFNKTYPDIDEEEIIATTKTYLAQFSEDAGRSLLPYFIIKLHPDGTKRSLLAEWAYAGRDMKQEVKRSNTDQL